MNSSGKRDAALHAVLAKMEPADRQVVLAQLALERLCDANRGTVQKVGQIALKIEGRQGTPRVIFLLLYSGARRSEATISKLADRLFKSPAIL